MIRKLAHLCLTTNNLERALSYYRDGVGLEEKFRFIADDGAWFGVYLACGDTTFIEIFDQHLAARQWGGDLSPLKHGSFYGHLCLEVTGLPEFCEVLRARGVAVGPVTTGIDSSLQAWSADPDGNKIEFMEYTHKSWQLAARKAAVSPK